MATAKQDFLECGRMSMSHIWNRFNEVYYSLRSGHVLIMRQYKRFGASAIVGGNNRGKFRIGVIWPTRCFLSVPRLCYAKVSRSQGFNVNTECST